jgi:hypothetical protein
MMSIFLTRAKTQKRNFNMSKLIQFAVIVLSLILSSVALFGGSAVATSIVLWYTFVASAFVLFCWIAVGASKAL